MTVQVDSARRLSQRFSVVWAVLAVRDSTPPMFQGSSVTIHVKIFFEDAALAFFDSQLRTNTKRSEVSGVFPPLAMKLF